MHLPLIGIPKSANTFIAKACELSLGTEHVKFCRPDNLTQQIDPRLLWEFMSKDRATGGFHPPANDFNLRILAEAKVRKIALLVRDPRDVVVSWTHWMRKPEFLSNPWHSASHVAMRVRTGAFPHLSLEDQFTDVLTTAMPTIQAWIWGWLDVMDFDPRFSIHIVRYEDFVKDIAGTVAALFKFFDVSATPVLPPIPIACDQIDPVTLFRRGEAGSHRTELTSAQRKAAAKLADQKLFVRMGWDHRASA